MKESITKLDLNFTNAGGGHTASVSTTVNPKNVDGSGEAGTVIGDIGEVNNFSNEDISRMMTNFVCTTKTVSADPTKKTITRRYVDKTTLILDSHVVLVRGLNIGPEGGNEFEGPLPFFTEVINSPLNSFRPLDPVKNGSVLEIGKIYNVESAANYQGLKISLVYHNKQLKEELCLNSEFISATYKSAPDLAQYDLKLGYTLKEFEQMLSLVGLRVIGLPTENLESILFEANGTLSSVISSVASYLGFFWYIDPETGFIRFINTEKAASIPITDHTDSSDSNVISASFTQSNIFNRIVNVYNGSTEKDRNDPKDDDRPRPVFLKRVRFEDLKGKKPLLNEAVIAAFFALFDQNESEDVFNKFAYLFIVFCRISELMEEADSAQVTHGSPRFDPLDGIIAGVDDDAYRTVFNLYEQRPRKNRLKIGGDFKRNFIQFRRFTYPRGANFFTYDDDPFKGQILFRDRNGTDPTIYNKLKPLAKSGLRPKGGRLNRVINEFCYYELIPQDNNGKTVSPLPFPSKTKLYTFLKLYFKLGGAIYISNGYSQYKSERMDFSNSSGTTILGPFHKDTRIDAISELSDINALLEFMGIENALISDFANAVQTSDDKKRKVVTVHDFHFIGFRAIKKLEREPKKLDGADNVVGGEPVDYDLFTDYIEIVEFPNKRGKRYIGGPTNVGDGEFIQRDFNPLGLSLIKNVRKIIKKSSVNYRQSTRKKKFLKATYVRSKTRVNKDNEEGEEQEDDDIAASSENDQKISDLFDRFDLKFNSYESPNYSNLNKLTLSSLSGSTPEMKLLREVRGVYRNTFDKPSSSSRTLYGLHIPNFEPTMNSISISVGSNGIQTTINESTIKLIPPDQQFLVTEGQEALTPKSTMPRSFTSSQRNLLGL